LRQEPLGQRMNVGAEKLDFGVAKWLANPSVGRIIAEATNKTQKLILTL
jgi:hypothetical protein